MRDIIESKSCLEARHLLLDFESKTTKIFSGIRKMSAKFPELGNKLLLKLL